MRSGAGRVERLLLDRSVRCDDGDSQPDAARPAL